MSTIDFQHVLEAAQSLPDIETVHENGQRFYLSPDGKFPSVTTVLSLNSKEGIEKWKKSVGEEKAEFIKKRAADKGNIIHQMMEDHVAGKEVKPPSHFYRSLFNPLKQHLSQNMKNAVCIETPLWSSTLKVAGRTDLIGYFDELEIVDYKGTTKPKKEKYIENYRMQACVYARMWFERTGIPIRKYRILIVDEFGELQVFKGSTSDKLLDFAKLRVKYQELYNQ